jgi:hypothetical protein
MQLASRACISIYILRLLVSATCLTEVQRVWSDHTAAGGHIRTTYTSHHHPHPVTSHSELTLYGLVVHTLACPTFLYFP